MSFWLRRAKKYSGHMSRSIPVVHSSNSAHSAHSAHSGKRTRRNRWDPRLNYPGSMGVVLRLCLYLNEYLSDMHVFVSAFKLNIILKSDIKKKRKFYFLYIIFAFKISGILSDSICDLVGSAALALNISAITNQILVNLISEINLNII